MTAIIARLCLRRVVDAPRAFPEESKDRAKGCEERVRADRLSGVVAPS